MEPNSSIFGDKTSESERLDDKVHLSKCNEMSDCMEHLQLSRRYHELQLELLEVDRSLCNRQVKDEFLELLDGELWDKRILALENLLGSLTPIIDNMDRLEQQLQAQFNSDNSKKLDVPYTHHKCLQKMLEIMATFLNDFESQVIMTSSIKNASCNPGEIIPNQLDCLFRLNAWFNGFNKLRCSLNRVFEHNNY